MWIRIEILGVGLFLILSLVTIAIYSILANRSRRREFAKNAARQIGEQSDWTSFPRVQSHLLTYVEIVALAGPGSTAAKQFRFTAETDPSMGGDDAVQVFSRIADIIDTMWRSAHK